MPVFNGSTPQFTIAVTTYKKNLALDTWLDTFLKFHNPELLSHLVVCDDDYPNAAPVVAKYAIKFLGKIKYVGGSRAGIAKNKNRGLVYFLTKTKDSHVILFDDDIQFIGAGLELAFLQTQWGHVNGYLGSPGIENSEENPYFKDFPSTGINWESDVEFSEGVQGISMFMTREVVEKVGYFDTDWKGAYGYEHAVYSARINKFFSYHPKYYARLRYCENYFITQMVPNAYEAKPKENEKQYNMKMENIGRGLDLVVRQPGVRRS